MSKINFQPIRSDSGNIVEAGHDGAGNHQVRFKSGLYQNSLPIPPGEWQKFEQTFQAEDSSGSHFHKNMKQYGFKKVEG